MVSTERKEMKLKPRSEIGEGRKEGRRGEWMAEESKVGGGERE